MGFSRFAVLALLLQFSLLTMVAAAAGSEGPSREDLDGMGPGPVPVTNQFQVNIASPGNQDHSRVGMAEDGSFVAVWETDKFSGKYQAILARRFAPEGSPIGNRFWVTWGSPVDGHEVAVDKDGDFVVLWHASRPDQASLRFRRLNSAGDRLGAEVDVATELPETKFDVDMDRSGEFVVVWTAESETHVPRRPISSGLDQKGFQHNFSLFGQRFSSDGAPVGAEFQIVADSLSDRAKPEVALWDSGFLVVWELRSLSEAPSIQGRAFDSMNLPLTSTFQISTTPRSYRPTVSANDAGDFVVAWEHWESYAFVDHRERKPKTLKDRKSGLRGPVSTGSRAQRIDGSGNFIGSEMVISETVFESYLRYPNVKVEPNGSFVVMWWRDDVIQAVRSDSQGFPLGELQQITSTGPEGSRPDQAQPDFAIDPAGRLAAVWDSYSSAGEDTSSLSVQGRMFFLPCEDGTTTCRSFFFDGFESGDTSAWSLSRP